MSLLAIVGWVVWTLLLGDRGQTPGKWLVGLRVVDREEGRALTPIRLLKRDLWQRPVGLVTALLSATWAIAKYLGQEMRSGFGKDGSTKPPELGQHIYPNERFRWDESASSSVERLTSGSGWMQLRNAASRVARR